MEWNHMIDEDTSDREKDQIQDDLRFDEERDRKVEEYWQNEMKTFLQSYFKAYPNDAELGKFLRKEFS